MFVQQCRFDVESHIQQTGFWGDWEVQWRVFSSFVRVPDSTSTAFINTVTKTIQTILEEMKMVHIHKNTGLERVL
jgi:hypothetical protein